MKSLGVLLLSIFALAGLVFGGLFLLDYLERSRSYFATFAEMEAAGMMSRGWLPEYLPRSASEIQEGHDIDTNMVWALFRYQPGDVEAVEAACRMITSNERGWKYLCPPFDSRSSTLVLWRDGTASYLSYVHGIQQAVEAGANPPMQPTGSAGG